MRTLLVADDNRVSRELARDILEGAGYRVEEAANGEEALTRIRDARPDLVLLDVAMPLKDGYAVLAEVRNDPSFAGLPVMAVTANGMQPDRERMRAAGFDSYLIKPISIAELRQRVRELLEVSGKGEGQ